MKYPLFGIIYNWKGLKEENYLYTAEELQKFDESLYEACMREPDAWHPSDKAQCAWKTWMGTMIYNDDRLRHFLDGTYNYEPDEDIDWYWENVRDNDLYGVQSDTMIQGLQDLRKETYLQKLAERALEHCISVDYDFITTNYDNWDEYLMETLGTTQRDVEELGGITLTNLWNEEEE